MTALKHTSLRVRRRRKPPRTPWGIYFRLFAVANGLLFVSGCLLGAALEFLPCGIGTVVAWRAARAVDRGDMETLRGCAVLMVPLAVASTVIVLR